MTNDRTLIIKVIKGSKEDKWLQAQKIKVAQLEL